MSEVPTCDWIGRSGQTYRYWIYSLPASFDPNQPGNYIIYARMDKQGYWMPIYVGQGDLNERVNNHHQDQCLRQKGATHFHCHDWRHTHRRRGVDRPAATLLALQ